MPLETPARLVRELASRGYNAEREAVTLLAGAPHPERALDAAVETAPDDALVVTADHVRRVLDADRPTGTPDIEGGRSDEADAPPTDAGAGGESPSDAPDTTATATDDPSSPTPDSTTATATDDPSSATGTPTPSDTGDPSSLDSGETDVSTPSDDRSSAESTAESTPDARPRTEPTDPPARADEPAEDPVGSSASSPATSPESTPGSPVETEGSDTGDGAASPDESAADRGSRLRDPDRRSVDVSGDVTGHSTGTGVYDDFVATFRDRYERLAAKLSGRVNRRPAEAVAEMPGGSEAALVGLVNDVRSTANGHWLVELEDTTGTFPCLVTKDRELADLVDLLLLDECVAVEGRLADDAGVLFADALHFPDVPRTNQPNTADREVAAALVSDVHVGSQEFAADAWGRFADWLHTDEAAHVEYLLIAGDMVEGVGVYPGQDEELDIVDIYDQYRTFAERLKEVPGDLEVVMVPGNHDAVRLAEPQPAFDEELREIMSAHDARVVGNPSTVTLEGVSVLMYHGVSLDEVIAELPDEAASYDEPHRAMYQLLRKRHVAPQYGGRMRLAPEDRDYLVVDDVPDVFHTGHVHKLGYGKYHGVLSINSGCWQEQTAFQRKVDIDPDVGYAPIVRLDTLDLTVRDFAP